MNITFIGGGNLATALIGGLLQQGFTPAALRAVEIDPEARARLDRDFGIAATADAAEGLAGADAAVFAVKPQQFAEVAKGAAPLVTGKLVISVAAGIRCPDISRWLGGHERIVRAMPNTPALIRAGITGLFAPEGVGAADREAAATVLAAVGRCLWVDREELMDGVTAVSASGAGYVFYFIEALQQSALELGFDAAQARLLAVETFLGGAKLAQQSPEDAATLRARVTSKGGTTERALSIMEAAGVKQHVVDAVKGAAGRGRELGDEFGSL